MDRALIRELEFLKGWLQVFDWLSLETYSFYHQDIPILLNYEKGTFFVNAFKGEIFTFQWEGKNEEAIF